MPRGTSIVQNSNSRTDLACGCTIGPLTSADLDIPRVDIGAAMLSIRSIHEQTDAADVDVMVRGMGALLRS